jgi:YVTN family beta-propeller protein
MQCTSHRARVARLLATTLFVASAAQIVMPAHAQTIGPQPGSDMALLPTGVFISPTAIPGSNQQLLVPQVANWPANYAASGALKSQLSPDGHTLAVITAGYNDVTLTNGSELNTEFIFIYDVSGANKATPKLMQTIMQNNTYVGLAWSGNTTLYVTGGTDDNVHVYTRAAAAPSSRFSATGTIALGHTKGIGVGVGANANGLAVSADGKILVVANDYNDSISVIDAASKAVVADYDLRPYSTSGQDGVAGGEFPWAVALKANGMAFISSVRDREVVVVDVSKPASPKFVTRIKLPGNPYGMTLSPDQSKLFVGQENADQVAVIDTASYKVLKSIDTRAPDGVLVGQGQDDQGQDKQGQGEQNRVNGRYTGVQPIAVTVSPDGKTLYAVNNGSNSIAVIPLHGEAANTTVALIPTAYAPKDITFSADGSQMYIINGKSNTGPNRGYNSQANEYQFQLEQGSLVSAPVPTGRSLDELTTQVAKNNLYSVQEPQDVKDVMKFLHDKIKHVIYVVRENRTYDQVLGDLNNGANGDPSLAQFGAAIRPNDHALAKTFVTLDNFMDAGDGSKDGWGFLMRGGINTYEELAQQLSYSGHPVPTQDEGTNNGVPVQLPTTAERDAATQGAFSKSTASLPGGTANVMPGLADVTELDASFGYQKSYIWEAALNAGLTVRSYGFGTWANVGPTKDVNGTPISDPYGAGVVQMVQTNKTLAEQGRTDLYYRGLDTTYPDTWRFREWLREFQQFEANGRLPTLSLVRLGEDHMGSFGNALAGLNTPEAQQADNDYAVGKLVETVAHSEAYANDTLIVIVEDDSQDGPDHYDSHRAPAFVVGPYVKQGAIVSTPYTLISAVRTIEDVLGTKHMNLNTAYARPMSDVFDIHRSPTWTFNAVASTVLQGTGLHVTLNDLGVKYAAGPVVKPKHDTAYWVKATRGFDFSDADRVPPGLFNKVLWKGMMGDKPYPVIHSAYKTTSIEANEDK